MSGGQGGVRYLPRIKKNGISLDELRQYIKTHREDTMGFYAYIDL
jgi:hypothetical protein